MTIVMIAEKPSAAKAIAEALADKGSMKTHENEQKVRYYEFRKGGKNHVVVAAVGHLFTLKQKGRGWTYPVFDVEWIPSFQATRTAMFSKKYFDVVQKVVGNGDEYIVCTDYDDEGSVIGYNILRFLCNRNDALRMKFSTMTKEELLESYEKPLKHLDFSQIESGLTRHYLDNMWGINLTRALTLSIKAAAKRFRILSTGRVQGPVLHMLAKHEKKVRAFKPKPFWEITLELKGGLKAMHAKDKIWSRGEADSILKKAKTASAAVKDIKKKLMTQKPPVPYNTTAFLADIYRYFGYSPQQGLSIAESLYQAGIISYPRTGSQQLPPDINYKKILSSLAKQPAYSKDTGFLLGRKELKPTSGKATSAAHPAIYPTGLYKKLGDKQMKVYDLVVRRFLAVFGDPAKREFMNVKLDANGEDFFLRGTKTIEPGWTALYGKYAGREEVILPEIHVGDKLAIKDVQQAEKETQPPPRYSQGSVLKAMEQAGLGTQATRANILQILYDRGYLIGKSIEVTELGMQLAEILEKNIPDVVSEKLTRHFEESTEAVQEGKMKREDVVEDSKKRLIKISEEFRKKEKKIGEELTNAVIATQDKQSILGTCRECGGTLKVHKSWRTKKRFVGCTGYKKGCRTGFPLPREGTIMALDKVCEECKTPMIQVSVPGRRPFRMCLDPNCPTKKEWLDKKKLKQVQADSRKASKLAQQLKCEVCSKSYSSQRALTLHMKSHKAEAKAEK
ncbi:MAG: DNA topoisomerase I [Candidatus Aenigmarchaeota archaeon]|nr:DNA topoisomerase I [Candidatus Aenigmarchaeota archaeon]